MLKRISVGIIFSALISVSFAATHTPNFVLLPNINKKINKDNQLIELVKRTLNITPASPYKTVRIRMIYNHQKQIESLIVYLLSNKYKSVELVRINLSSDFNVTSIIKNYQLIPEDLSQSPHYAHKMTPTCPDESVQFVIGNNFYDDTSVEEEVQKVYEMAKMKGYHPYLMDVNNSAGPHPTVQEYENWLSCPNVKGFYNESHGWNEGIVLTDDDFVYSLIDQDLINKMKYDVILFDSCLTFRDPLLSSMTNPDSGDTQQYIAGYISLPFGPSEKTAACIWTEAFNHQALNQKMIEDCAIQNDLKPDGFKIKGNGDNHLEPAHEST